MARKKYTYIPLEEIDYIETMNGKTIEGSELLDGAYVRGRKKYAEGGEVEWKKAVTKSFPTKSEAFKRKNMSETYYGNSARNFKVVKSGNAWAVSFEYVPNDVLGDKYAMADGGMTRKHRRRKKSLEERAEELVGSQEWHMLDRAEKADVISEMITEGILPVFAKGGVADAQSYKVKFTLSNNEIVEVDYSSKEDMDNGIADFYLANDVENVEVIEQEEKKKGLFDMAKKAPVKKSASKEKPEVIVEGIESEIARYDELKEIINNAKAEQEIIGGKLKAIGTEEFLNMYEEDKRKPENFNLADGDEKILFIVMDKYKKVEPEKAAILRKYKDLLEEVTTYSFNPEVLDRVGDVVSNLILNSDELSDEDKKRLLIVDTTVAIKKGSIDRLMDYDNPEEIYALIEPIVALK